MQPVNTCPSKAVFEGLSESWVAVENDERQPLSALRGLEHLSMCTRLPAVDDLLMACIAIFLCDLKSVILKETWRKMMWYCSDLYVHRVS